MKIGERKELKPLEVIFLIMIIGATGAGIYHYRDIFWKKSVNMFEEVKKSTMEQARQISTKGQILETMRDIVCSKGPEHKTTEENLEAPANEGVAEVMNGRKETKRTSNFVKGVDLINQGDDLRAQEYLRPAIIEQKNDPEPHFWLGVSYLNMDKPKQAIPEIEQAALLAPENIEYLMNLSMAYFQVGKKGKSKEILAVARKIAPDNQLVQETLDWLQ